MALDKLKPAKSGCFQSFKYFEDNVELLEDVSRYLFEQEDCVAANVDLSPAGVLVLAKCIIRVSESLHAPKAKGSVQPTHTRLPMKLFHDISHGGSLCQIIRTGLQCKQDLDLKRLEFSERYVEQFEELMLRVEDALVAQHMYRKPHVFFSSSIDADTIAQLKALVRAKGGTISTSEGAATHIITPAVPIDESEAGEDFLRPVKTVNNKVRAHWWFHPDSYDIWVNASHFQAEDGSGIPPTVDSADPFADERSAVQSCVRAKGKAQQSITVNARWLLDLSKFNEWMNEDDYEAAPAEQAAPEAPSTGGRRKRAEVVMPVEEEKETRSLKVTISLPKKKPAALPAVAIDGAADSAVRAATRVRVARLPAQADDDEPVLRYRVVGMVSGKAASTPSVPPPALPSFLSPVTPTEPARKRTKLAMDTPASSVKPEPVTEEKKSARKFAQETPSEVRPEARSTQKRGVAAAAAAAAVVAEEALAIQRTVVIPDSLKPVGRDGSLAYTDAAAAFSAGVISMSATNLSQPSTTQPTSTLLQSIRATQAPAAVLVPTRAAWYSAIAIHDIERDALPEFFSVSRAFEDLSVSEAAYIRQRNRIVDAYRANSRVYLTATACRRMLVGDACALLRLHSFLESWGLINFQCDSASLPVTMLTPVADGAQPNQATRLVSFQAPVYTNAVQSLLVDAPVAGVPRSALNSSPAVGSLLNSATSAAFRRSVFGSSTSTSLANTSKTALAPQLFISPAVHAPQCTVPASATSVTALNAAEAPAVQSCRHCGIRLRELLYACRLQEGYSLCSKCFASGFFPAVLCSADFVRLGPEMVSLSHAEAEATEAPAPAEPSSGGALIDPEGWSPAETLRLLEALEQHGEDWRAVAAFVGNKSVEACITHFLQLPLEEPFLDSQLQVFKSSTELPVPFSSAPNPVMAQVAFLTAHVAPAVGAAAASAALQTLGTSSTSNAGDAMEVDSKPDANTQSVSLSDSQQQEAARAALKAAALTAQQMAVDEDRKALKLAAQLVALHMRKVELKMRYWDELENSLLRDREMVERARQQLINERQALYQSGHSLTAVPRS